MREDTNPLDSGLSDNKDRRCSLQNLPPIFLNATHKRLKRNCYKNWNTAVLKCNKQLGKKLTIARKQSTPKPVLWVLWTWDWNVLFRAGVPKDPKIAGTKEPLIALLPSQSRCWPFYTPVLSAMRILILIIYKICMFICYDVKNYLLLFWCSYWLVQYHIRRSTTIPVSLHDIDIGSLRSEISQETKSGFWILDMVVFTFLTTAEIPKYPYHPISLAIML